MSLAEKTLAPPLPIAEPPRRKPGRLALDLAAVRVLTARDVKRFFRQKSRVVGALAQPVLFWLLIGAGMGQSFRLPGMEHADYLQYFFPGILVLVVLFTSIFTTMSVIEDRHEGFLQAVLVAPASRPAIVLGKTLGGVAIALVQAGLVVLLAPWAGYPIGAVEWPMVAAMLLLTSVGLAALGFALAWWLDSTQGYHAIMFVLLIPLWVMSGAMFPLSGASSFLGAAMRWNPLAYCVAGVRRGLAGGQLGDAVGVAGSSAARELAVVAGFAVLALALATWMVSRRARSR